jgi:pilus assembly protein Flp/PilA
MLMQHGSKAQGLVEYGLILMLAAIVILVVLALLGPAVGNLFSNVMYNF